MKNMWKLLLCLMLVVCMALSMVACGSSEKDEEEKETNETIIDTTKPLDEDESESEDESEDESSDTEEVTEEILQDATNNSLEGYYSCVMLFPTESVHEMAQAMLDAMECYDIELSELSSTDALTFGFAYYVDITADTMNFTYDYTSTQYLFDEFRANLYNVMWEALEKQAEMYEVEWSEMEQSCQDNFGTDIDGYINLLLDSTEEAMDLENQSSEQSSYTLDGDIITIDGEDLDCLIDGIEVYISMDGELLFYLVRE